MSTCKIESFAECRNVTREYLEQIFDVKIINKKMEDELRMVLNHNCKKIIEQYELSLGKSYAFGQIASRTIRYIRNIQDVPVQFVKVHINGVKNIILFLATGVYNAVVTKEISYPKDRRIEMIANVITFCISNNIDYSWYLTCFPSGQELIKNTLYGKDNLEVILTWIGIFYSVSVLKNYDNLFFRQEFNIILKPELEWLGEKIKELAPYTGPELLRNFIKQQSLLISVKGSIVGFSLFLRSVVNIVKGIERGDIESGYISMDIVRDLDREIMEEERERMAKQFERERLRRSRRRSKRKSKKNSKKKSKRRSR